MARCDVGVGAVGPSSSRPLVRISMAAPLDWSPSNPPRVSTGGVSNSADFFRIAVTSR